MGYTIHATSLTSYAFLCSPSIADVINGIPPPQVREPEDEFSMDHYYEATLIAKPVIYISLAEICDTHQLLLDYR